MLTVIYRPDADCWSKFILTKVWSMIVRSNQYSRQYLYCKYNIAKRKGDTHINWNTIQPVALHVSVSAAIGAVYDQWPLAVLLRLCNVISSGSTHFTETHHTEMKNVSNYRKHFWGRWVGLPKCVQMHCASCALWTLEHS